MTGISGKSDFRLLRFFTTTSVVAFVIVAVLLGYAFRKLSIDAMISSCESEHANLAKVLATELLEHNMELVLHASAITPEHGLEPSPRIVEMKREIVALLKGTTIFKIKLYNLKGLTAFSTELKQIGEDKSKNAGVIGSLQGQNSSKLTHRNTFSAFEGEIQNLDLVESYIPVYDSA
ncbi:MAG: hypothetical protein WCL71_10130, partial [Deltaproteobacteria bacterium]